MIRTILDKGSKVAALDTKGRITRIPDDQKYFLFEELRRMDKLTKDILIKNKWVPVGPKELTTWQT